MEIKNWLISSVAEFKSLCKEYNWDGTCYYYNDDTEFDFWLTKELVLKRTSSFGNRNYSIGCTLIPRTGINFRDKQTPNECDLFVDGFVVATFDLDVINTPERLLSESNIIIKNFFQALAARCD